MIGNSPALGPMLGRGGPAVGTDRGIQLIWVDVLRGYWSGGLACRLVNAVGDEKSTVVKVYYREKPSTTWCSRFYFYLLVSGCVTYQARWPEPVDSSRGG